MKDKAMNFMHKYANAIIVLNIKSREIIYSNIKSNELYDIQSKHLDYTKIFDIKDFDISNEIEEKLKVDKVFFMYNLTSINSKGEKFLVNLSFSHFDDDKQEAFLEIILQNDIRMEMALNQVNQALRPEAILNFDEKLSIIHCNASFHDVFDSNEELRHSHFQNDLVNGFLPEVRQQLINDILSTLKNKSTFSTKIKVFSVTGEEYWYLFELEKRALDNSGQDKVICYMTNIEKQIELEEEYSLLNEYLNATQELTEDILYHFDVKNNLLHHKLTGEIANRLGDPIYNYVDVFIKEKIIHPDDIDIFLNALDSFYGCDIEKIGLDEKYTVRAKLLSDNYRWYVIKGKKIFDKDGKLSIIIGSMIDVDRRYKLQEEMSTLNQYLDAMKSLSNESLYTIDIKTRILRCAGEVIDELGMPSEVGDYPNGVYDLVHPDELNSFKNFANNSLSGKQSSVKMRIITAKGSYKWYELHSMIIYNSQNFPIEIFGRIKDIDHQMNMTAQVSTLNQYLDTMQGLSDESLYTVDLNTKLLRCKGIANIELGLPAEVRGYPESVYHLVHINQLNDFKEFANKSINGINSNVKIQIQNIDDRYQWYELINMIITDESGKPIEILGRIKNIEDQVNILSEVSTFNRYFDAMQGLSDESLYTVNLRTKTLRCKGIASIELGLPAELNGYPESVYHLVPDSQLDEFKKFAKNSINGINSSVKIQIKNADGSYQWYELINMIITNDYGKPIEILGKIKNIEHHINMQKKATLDLMTGILNKESFRESVSNLLNKNTHINGSKFSSFVFLDVDDFKYVNDNFGHSFGDFVLIYIAKRVKNCIKSTGLIGRFGGDEFVLYLQGISDEEMALERVNTILQRLQKPISNSEFSHKIGLSIGVAIVPKEEGITLEKLEQMADKAVYISKKRGKNVATIYNQNI